MTVGMIVSKVQEPVLKYEGDKVRQYLCLPESIFGLPDSSPVPVTTTVASRQCRV
jgi:hypothetical protein